MNKPRSSSSCPQRQASYKAKRAVLEQNPAFDQIVEAFQKTLRDIAHNHRRKERYCTMGTIEIVSEAYMRLRRNVPVGIEDAAEFRKAATVIVREILVDAARRRKARKRGGDQVVLTLSNAHGMVVTWDETLLDLERCLDELGEGDACVAEAIDMQFYGGCTVQEIAIHQGVSPSTVARNLRTGLLWLRAKTGLEAPSSYKKAA